jgi:hypothetical protein
MLGGQLFSYHSSITNKTGRSLNAGPNTAKAEKGRERPSGNEADIIEGVCVIDVAGIIEEACVIEDVTYRWHLASAALIY